MAIKKHSNLLQNPNRHHLYAVYDFEKREFCKFGISDKPVKKDFTSARLVSQVVLFNRIAGWKRFAGRILIYSIQGRVQARKFEDEVILKFQKRFGRFPRGNPKHQFLKRD